MHNITVEIAPGELIDKLTILSIKLERINNPAKRDNVRREYDLLHSVLREKVPSSSALEAVSRSLREVNEALWDIEDEIRDCERLQDFGARFVELARSVYRTNDRRAALKREINDLLGSHIIEEKSYSAY